MTNVYDIIYAVAISILAIVLVVAACFSGNDWEDWDDDKGKGE